MPKQVHPVAGQFQQSENLRERYKAIPHPDDLHVTLFFIGSMDEQKLEDLEESLQEAALSHRPFEIRLDRFDFFGPKTGPRVVYLGLEESRPLQLLQQDVTRAVGRSLGLPPEGKQFTPHVTIAKKRKTDERLEFSPEPLGPISVSVQSFQLFTIHPALNPKYETVRSFMLGS
ncbi:RNA 2',3'-cyclic phosphodiesterase [Bhargavaea ullalensis]